MRKWLARLDCQGATRQRQVFAYAELARIFEYFQAFTMLLFEDSAAEQFDNLRARKIRLGTMDLKIAAIALRQPGLAADRKSP